MVQKSKNEIQTQPNEFRHLTNDFNVIFYQPLYYTVG